ncbi:mll0485 [Mesorhizobium japonicum MAFF 303099]|uniref:Mll0485 protein n=1 Tax=Mesorhizobium japonicum (strain LMG 29417 / CECT 9101 / MAFF 303099) TaxID=266835 RepID=Q98MQ0_RHILO|nr:mll0485 [Mesorhizobium japonicum MAFF 303099]
MRDGSSVRLPPELLPYRQFVVWRLEQKPGSPKPAKMPYSANGGRADTTNPATWSDYPTAVRALASGQYAGIGFVFAENDPFFVIDLDGCRDATTGELSAEAAAITRMFPNAAWELSQSGEGIHIFGRCDKVALGGFRNKWAGWCEFYRTKRFVAFGPGGIQGNIDIDWTNQLAILVPARGVGEQDASQEAVERDPRWIGPDDDEELLRRFLASTGGTKAKLQASPTNLQLWEAHAAALAQYFPSATGKPFDHSSADQALANVLAFWTGRDYGRIIRLFGRSALGRREKWTRRAAYRNSTVNAAVRSCQTVYGGNGQERRSRQVQENVRIGSDIGADIHTRVMTLEDMLQDLWFIRHSKSGGAIADSRTLNVLPFATAQREYSASRYEVAASTIDPKTGDFKKRYLPVFNQWEQSPSRKSVDVITWKPNGAVICEAPESQGAGFNTWRGFQPYRLPDGSQSLVEVWSEHLAYLIPIEAERVRFEQWLAHIVQRPEELPQSAYLFITEETGIGRNWLSSVLVRVLRGYVAAGIDIQEMLDGTFNGRLSRKLLAVVDEAKAGMQGYGRWSHSEKLKSMINPEMRRINEKHGLEFVEWNCCRWLFFSNNWDALPFDASDRRFNVVANPTHRQSPDYYERIYSQIANPDFISAVRKRLELLDISGFKPGAIPDMNEAKRKALGAMASDLDNLLAAFRDEWPGPLAERSDVINYLHVSIAKLPGEKTINKLIEQAGMKLVERISIGPNKYRFVVVRDYTAQQIETNPQWAYAEAVNARGKYGFRQG